MKTKKYILLVLVLLMSVSVFAAVDYNQVEWDTMLQPATERFLNVPAASATNYLTARNATQNFDTYEPQGATAVTEITQPRTPMTVRVQVLDTGTTNSTNKIHGVITLAGRDARNQEILEKFTVVSSSATTFTFDSYLAFARIDAVNFDNTFLNSATITDTVSLGNSNKVGLAGPIQDDNNVYKIQMVSPSMVLATTANLQLTTEITDVAVTSANVNPSGNYYEGFGDRYRRTSVIQFLTEDRDYKVHYRQWNPSRIRTESEE